MYISIFIYVDDYIDVYVYVYVVVYVDEDKELSLSSECYRPGEGSSF
jgi:hypothetical protein